MILVEIAGFLGADAEERFTATGKRVVSLRIATKVRHGGQDETVWWRVNIWGERYDKMLPYLKKGSAVIVVGEMAKPETYTSRDGATQISLTMTAEILKFSPFGRPAEKGNESSMPQQAESQFASQSQGVTPPPQQQYAGFAAAAESETPAFSGDDLPF
ncbi:MAG: Single-stranded DNA-binding protein [Chlamydiales bacterium]|nr:Single-stranded DNA-binding protein [Chlamydiales bacterium]